MPCESKVVEVSMLASRESQPVELSSIEWCVSVDSTLARQLWQWTL